MATLTKTVSAGINVTSGETIVYVDDVDRTQYVITGSISVVDELNSKVNTCSFMTYDLDGTWTITEGDEVRIVDHYGQVIFGGVVVKISERRNSVVPNTGVELLKYQIDCQDFTKLLQKKLIIETYESQTCFQIIEAIINKYFSADGFTLNNVETGPTITQIAFNYKAGDKSIDSLAKAVGYEWYVDYDKDIHFFDPTGSTSKLTITDSTTNWTNLVITPDKSQIRNRIYVRGGIYYSDPYTQDIEADGTAVDFTLAYTPNTTGFGVVVSSVSRTVGLKNIDAAAGYDFLLDRKEKTLSMGASAWALANSPLAAGTVIEATYEYEIPVLIVLEDSDSIAALAAIEGGDGVYEHIIVDKNITSIQAARDRANAELRDYANTIVKGSVDTYEGQGLSSGDLITINSTRRNLNADYLIQSIRISQINKNLFRHSIQFNGKLYGFVDILINLFKRSQEIVLGLDEVLDAFNSFSDSLNGIIDHTPIANLGAPPYKWSNDAGTTTNKMRWNLFQWA